jgi:hypothetical protein
VTKFVYKEKIKPDGTLDKLKCRGALRGDELTRLLRALGIKPTPTYSPTISTLTFMTVLSLAVIFKMYKATMDVISAYLQIAYPDSARPILVKLDKRICDLLGIDANLRYRVKKYVYGLPDAGRQFYLGFTKVLADRYTMSKCDPCLFYRMEGDEKTFICIHVDDCYIFSNEKKYIDRLQTKVEEVYPVTTLQASWGSSSYSFPMAR